MPSGCCIAGSRLQTGKDYLAAEGAIAESLALTHPDFEWVIHRGGPGLPEPARTPGAQLRLSFGRENVKLHADLVPRHASPTRVPGMTLRLEDSPEGAQARKWLDDFVRHGGRLALRDGMKVQLSDVPPPFGDLLGDPLSGELVLRAVPTPAPYYATAIAGSPDERVSLDVDLLPTDPSDDWDAVLEGRVGGLTVTLRFRWVVHEGQGESRLAFHYVANSGAPHEVEARVLGWLLATHHDGAITLKDRRGERPVVAHATTPQPIPAWLELWAQLHSDLAELERAAGKAAPPPPKDVTMWHAEAIGMVARMLRACRYPFEVSEMTMDFAPQATTALGGVVADIEVRRTLVANVFGSEMPVAREVIRMPPMVVRERGGLPAGGWRLKLVPLGSETAEVIAELMPLEDSN